MANDTSLDPKTEADKDTGNSLDNAPAQSMSIQSQSAKSILKQQRKQMAATYRAQIVTPSPTPTPAPTPSQRPTFQTRIRTIFSRQKPPQQPPLQAPSGGGAKHGGSFSALNQYTQKLQQSKQLPTTPASPKKGGGAGLMALGALGGLAGSAGKKLAPQQPAHQYQENASGQKGIMGYEKEKTTSDHGYVEKYITIPEIPGARERAIDFFNLATRHPELYNFHPFLNDQKKIGFEAFLKNNPDVPRNVLDLKQTWMQYWNQFPEGMKSEREQVQREQETTAPSPTQPSQISTGILSLASLPAVGALTAKDTLDPEHKHQKQVSEIVSKWQKANPSATLSGELFVANPDGSLAVNHKLFDQVPELLDHEKSRSFAYKDPSHDPLIQHIRSTANNETEQEIKRQGLTITNDKQKISQIKSGILEKHYDQFIKDSPHLAEAYKNHPHVNAAMKRANPSTPPIQAPQPLSRGSQFFQRLRQPQIRYARGNKNSKNQRATPGRQPGARRSLSPSFFPSLPGPLGLFSPAKYSSLLLILFLGGLALFLLFSDVDPVQVDQSKTAEGAQIQQQCYDSQGNLQTENCAPVDNPDDATSALRPQKNLFAFLRFSFTAFAQANGTGSDTGVAPTNEDISYVLTVNYAKASKDIVVREAIPDNATYIRSEPEYTRRETDGGRVLYVEWSLKKLQNPTLSDTELATKTLPAVTAYKIKLILRPRPGVKDTHIINQAEAVLDPLAGSSGPGSPTDPGLSLSCEMASPTEAPWPNVNRWNTMIANAIQLAKQTEGVEVAGNVVKAIMMMESGGEELAPNTSGYLGLMQVATDTAQGGGSNCDWNQPAYNVYTTQGNLNCGVQHLARGLKTCNGNMPAVIGQYFTGSCDYGSAGPDGFGTTPNAYVNKVLGTYSYLNSVSATCK